MSALQDPPTSSPVAVNCKRLIAHILNILVRAINEIEEDKNKTIILKGLFTFRRA